MNDFFGFGHVDDDSDNTVILPPGQREEPVSPPLVHAATLPTHVAPAVGAASPYDETAIVPPASRPLTQPAAPAVQAAMPEAQAEGEGENKMAISNVAQAAQVSEALAALLSQVGEEMEDEDFLTLAETLEPGDLDVLEDVVAVLQGNRNEVKRILSGAGLNPDLPWDQVNALMTWRDQDEDDEDEEEESPPARSAPRAVAPLPRPPARPAPAPPPQAERAARPPVQQAAQPQAGRLSRLRLRPRIPARAAGAAAAIRNRVPARPAALDRLPSWWWMPALFIIVFAVMSLLLIAFWPDSLGQAEPILPVMPGAGNSTTAVADAGTDGLILPTVGVPLAAPLAASQPIGNCPLVPVREEDLLYTRAENRFGRRLWAGEDQRIRTVDGYYSFNRVNGAVARANGINTDGYTVASGSLVAMPGVVYDDNGLQLATWYTPLGTQVEVCGPNACAVATVVDRGPDMLTSPDGPFVVLTSALARAIGWTVDTPHVSLRPTCAP